MSTRTQIMVHLSCYVAVCLLVALWSDAMSDHDLLLAIQELRFVHYNK